MLNKEICLKCFLKEKVNLEEEKFAVENWTHIFNNKWKFGYCECMWIIVSFKDNFKENGPGVIEITSNPPDTCPYILEHTMANQKFTGDNK